MTKPQPEHFDADAMAAANEEPELVIGSMRYHGRILSAPEWFTWRDRAIDLTRRIQEEQATERDLLGHYFGFFRDVFPRSRFRWWAPDPVPILMAQPFVLVTEAYQRFFELQARANSLALRASQANGTDSSASTNAGPIVIGRVA